jgi:hypothetical protein
VLGIELLVLLVEDLLHFRLLRIVQVEQHGHTVHVGARMAFVLGGKRDRAGEQGRRNQCYA